MKPWKTAMSTNCCPQTLEMIGKVVSAVVAPPAVIGASGPAILTSKPAARSVNTSRIILVINAIVPSIAPLLSEMSTLESE